MKEQHVEAVVEMIDKVLMNIDDENTINSVKAEVHEYMKQFPLYPSANN